MVVPAHIFEVGARVGPAILPATGDGGPAQIGTPPPPSPPFKRQLVSAWFYPLPRKSSQMARLCTEEGQKIRVNQTLTSEH